MLRKGFQDEGVEKPPILSGRQMIQLNPDFPLAVDVQQFDAALFRDTLAGRQEANDLYRSSFLDEFFSSSDPARVSYLQGRPFR